MTSMNPPPAHSIASGTALGKFPPLTSSSLEKQEFRLPQDFAGDRNLIFVAFEREQQVQVDTWLKQIKRFQQAEPKLEYYELPAIDKLNPFARFFINSGMRSGIPDRSARAHTITLYLAKQPFKDALQIPNEKTIYTFVVNKAGDVLWRAEGPFDENKGGSLLEYLRSAQR